MRGKLKPAEPLKPLIERAFELAQSGSFTNVETIEYAMGEEGYPRSSPHWNSAVLRKQLREACRKASTEPA